MDIGAWGQQHVASVFQHLVAHSCSRFLYQVGVPCAGQCRGNGKGCGIVSVDVVTWTFGADAHTGRAIEIDRRCYAQAGHIIGDTGSTIDNLVVLADHRLACGFAVVIMSADDDVHFLLNGHRLDDVVNVVLVEF